MSETDSENWYAALDQSTHSFDSIRQACRVTWAVRKKDAIRFHRKHFIGGCIRRDNGHVRAVTGKVAQNIFLDSKIVGDNRPWMFDNRLSTVYCPRSPALHPLTSLIIHPMIGFFTRYFLDHVTSVESMPLM